MSSYPEDGVKVSKGGVRLSRPKHNISQRKLKMPRSDKAGGSDDVDPANHTRERIFDQEK